MGARMSNPQDTIRDAILRHLYDIHRNARSPKTAGRGIKDLVHELKPLGHKQQDIASNLDYLVQKGWVREQKDNRTFTTPKGTTQQAEKRLYKISDTGIDRLETASIYKRAEIAPHVNITNIHGVTVVGEGNVVNVTFTELVRVLTEMRKAVLAGPIGDQDKLDAVSDIDSLQAQLQKPNPNRGIVKALWAGIEKVAKVSTIVELAEKARTLIGPLL
jgi:hypothetical protein